MVELLDGRYPTLVFPAEGPYDRNFSRFVGLLFIIGIIDVGLELERVPYLEAVLLSKFFVNHGHVLVFRLNVSAFSQLEGFGAKAIIQGRVIGPCQHSSLTEATLTVGINSWQALLGNQFLVH